MGWLTWGGESGSSRVKVGIDVEATANADQSAYHLKVHFYAQAAYGINDRVYLDISGSGGNFATGWVQMTGTGLYHFHTIDHGWQGTSYGGGPHYSWGVSLGDYHSSPAPSHSIGWALPGRPAGVPDAPAIELGTITSNSAGLHVHAAGTHGAAVTAYESICRRNRDGVDILNWGGGSGTVHGLERNTGYHFYSRAHGSGVGWGPWAGPLFFTTLPTVPDAPTALRLASVSATGASVAWTSASDGGSPVTSAGVQVATDPAFSTVVGLFGTGSLTGLKPGSTYWARVREANAYGPGAWSSPVSFSTLATVKVNWGGRWVDALPYVNWEGRWVPAGVYHNRNGSWTH